MKQVFFLTLPLLLLASSSFISEREYAAQLYKNPRGIGCQFCHGENGEGKLIAEYIHKKKQKSFRGPPIDEIASKEFYKALNKGQDGMPRYYLTQKEMEALYFYIHKDDKKESVNVK
jgi:hypothetical protein